MQKSKLLILALPVLLIISFTQFAVSQDISQIMTAKDFWQEFQNNKQDAETRYIGQTLKYTGIVAGTGISIYMTPNVMLSDSSDGQTYLICVLPRADVNKLSEFKKGDKITMIGRVYRSKSGGGVVIKECKQVSEND